MSRSQLFQMGYAPIPAAACERTNEALDTKTPPTSTHVPNQHAPPRESHLRHIVEFLPQHPHPTPWHRCKPISSTPTNLAFRVSHPLAVRSVADESCGRDASDVVHNGLVARWESPAWAGSEASAAVRVVIPPQPFDVAIPPANKLIVKGELLGDKLRGVWWRLLLHGVPVLHGGLVKARLKVVLAAGLHKGRDHIRRLGALQHTVLRRVGVPKRKTCVASTMAGDMTRAMSTVV